jgi:hypothetical protein
MASPARAEPGWRVPSDVSIVGAAAPQWAFDAQVAVDAQGNAVAVWSRGETIPGALHTVQSATRAAGADWQAPVDLSEAGQDAYSPAVAVDPHGNAVAVWVGSPDGQRTEIVQGATRAAGAGWQAPVDLSVPSTYILSSPQVAVDAQGNALALWSRSDGTNGVVQSATRGVGGGWQAPVDVSLASQHTYSPELAVNPHGDAVAVWLHPDGFASAVVQGATRAAGAGWQAPVDLSGPSQSSLSLPVPADVAIDAQGAATAIWSQFNGTNDLVQSATRAPGTGWQAPVDVSVAGQNASSPQIAVDPTGNSVAVWERGDPTSSAIVQGATRVPGEGWRTPVDLSVARPNSNSYAPHVAVGAQGNAVTVWTHSDTTGNTTVQSATRTAAAGAWRAPVDLTDSDQGVWPPPQVTVDPQGNAVAVWSGYKGTDFLVRSAGYDAAGPLLGSLMMPSSGVTGQALSFSVSPVDVWSPMGATSWNLGDGASVTGPAVTHSYANAGNYTVAVTATDALNNATTATRAITITAAPPPPPPPPPAGAPAASFKRSPKSLRVTKSGTFSYPFDATPRSTATISLKSTKKVKIASQKLFITLAPRAFTAPPTGHVTAKLKLSSKHLKALKKSKTLTFVVTVAIAGRPFTTKLALQAPKKT